MKRSFIFVSSVTSLLALSPGCERADSPPSEEDVGEAQQALCDASNLQPFIQDIPEQTGSSWLGISPGEVHPSCDNDNDGDPDNDTDNDDDTCSIQAAIDSLLDLNDVPTGDPSPKTVLYLREGTYLISRPIDVRGFGISLIGAGVGKSILKWIGPAYDPVTPTGMFAWPNNPDDPADDPPFAGPCPAPNAVGKTGVECCDPSPATTLYCKNYLSVKPLCTASPVRCDTLFQSTHGHTLPAMSSTMLLMDGTNHVRVSRLGLDGSGTAETAIRVYRKPYEDSTPLTNSFRFSGTSMSFTDLRIKDVQRGIWVGAVDQGNNDNTRVERVQFMNVGAARAHSVGDAQDGAIVLDGREALGWMISDNLFSGCSIGVAAHWGSSFIAWGNRFQGSTLRDFDIRMATGATIRSNYSTGSTRFVNAPWNRYAQGDILIMDNTVISEAASTGTDYEAGIINVQTMGNTFISGNTFVTQSLPVIVTAGENTVTRTTSECGGGGGPTFIGCGLQLVDNVFQTPTPTAGEVVTVSSDSPLPAAWAWAFTYNRTELAKVTTLCNDPTLVHPHITTFDNVAAPPGFVPPAMPLPVFTNVAPASTPVFQISPVSNPACSAAGLSITECIQKTFDDAVDWAANTQQNPGQVRPFVHIAAGKYNIAKTLQVRSHGASGAPSPGIAIVGDGPNTRLFWKGVDANGAPTDDHLLDFQSPARATVTDLMLQGRTPAPEAAGPATPSFPADNQGRGMAIHVPDIAGSQIYINALTSDIDASKSWVVPTSVNLLVDNLDHAFTRFDGPILGGGETGVRVLGNLGPASAGTLINGGAASVLPRVYSVGAGGKLVATELRVEGAESNPLPQSNGSLSLVGGAYLSQTRLSSEGAVTLDSTRLGVYASHPEIDATAFSGDVAIIGTKGNLSVLNATGRAVMVGHTISNADNAFAPFLWSGPIAPDPPVDCQLQMPASGTSPNAAMVASRLIDSTLYGVDCADRLPAANSTALIREVTAHARDLAPQRLVSSCSNAAGDMRVHRVFVWMAGSYNAVTISE